jgi:peroxiredoxin
VVLSVSCDTPHTLKVYATQEGLAHSLLSDFWPHGEVAQAYGVFLPEKGFATRGTFVIDKTGIVRWSVINAPGEARSAEEYAAVLAGL